MSITSISVPGIHCDHCKAAIEGAVSGLSGVRGTNVSVEQRNVTVDYDESQVDIEAILDAIEDQGYDVPEVR